MESEIDNFESSFKSSKEVSETVIDLIIKLATLALFIGNSISQLALTRNDQDAIDRATTAALAWADLTTMYDEMLIA